MESDSAMKRAGDIFTVYMGPHDLIVNMGVHFMEDTMAERMLEAICHIEAYLRKAYPEINCVSMEARALPGKVTVDCMKKPEDWQDSVEKQGNTW
jgi:hypothetical protein